MEHRFSEPLGGFGRSKLAVDRTKAPCVIEKLLFCFSVALGQKPVVLNPELCVAEATVLELWTLCAIDEDVEAVDSQFKIVQTFVICIYIYKHIVHIYVYLHKQSFMLYIYMYIMCIYIYIT